MIQRLIGRGGVGLVYLSTDTQDGDREVVVKVLAPHWAEDRDAVVRFDREAKRMAELDHPNVVKMYDHGHFEGRTYIVMEFIRGEPLRRYLNRRKRLPLEEFVPIVSQILMGVGYVHERGIMMRDIKPPNIMLCEHGGKANHVKMLDFGLARLIEEDEEDDVTKAHVIGTAAYMSPEQIRGEKIDVRVDVYALGVLFFLMLTGETPISGDNDAAVLVNHVHGKPKRLVERLPTNHRIPPKLVELIESCLAKEPDDRPVDATAMAEALFEIVPAPLFELPEATAKSRVAAETYWAARMSSGAANIAALKSDTSDSAEWTRPLLRKAARTGEAPLKLAEEEIAALKEKAQQELPRRKRSPTGSGVRPRPRVATPGSGARAMPPPPPPPPPPGGSRLRSPTGSGLMPRPKPGSGARPLPSDAGSGAVPLPRTGSGVRPLPSDAGSGAVPLPKPGSGARPLPP
ncbi:MAG: protein kinase, partial [Myxococcales bacterium]|nr:protein kinase [Myxococcales bacterium]